MFCLSCFVKTGMFCWSRNGLLIQKCFVYPEMFCISRNVLFNQKCFVYPGIFCLSRNVLYNQECSIYPGMFCISRNVLYIQECSIYPGMRESWVVKNYRKVFEPFVRSGQLKEQEQRVHPWLNNIRLGKGIDFLPQIQIF